MTTEHSMKMLATTILESSFKSSILKGEPNQALSEAFDLSYPALELLEKTHGSSRRGLEQSVTRKRHPKRSAPSIHTLRDSHSGNPWTTRGHHSDSSIFLCHRAPSVGIRGEETNACLKDWIPSLARRSRLIAPSYSIKALPRELEFLELESGVPNNDEQDSSEFSQRDSLIEAESNEISTILDDVTSSSSSNLTDEITRPLQVQDV